MTPFQCWRFSTIFINVPPESWGFQDFHFSTSPWKLQVPSQGSKCLQGAQKLQSRITEVSGSCTRCHTCHLSIKPCYQAMFLRDPKGSGLTGGNGESQQSHAAFSEPISCEKTSCTKPSPISQQMANPTVQHFVFGCYACQTRSRWPARWQVAGQLVWTTLKHHCIFEPPAQLELWTQNRTVLQHGSVLQYARARGQQMRSDVFGNLLPAFKLLHICAQGLCPCDTTVICCSRGSIDVVLLTAVPGCTRIKYRVVRKWAIPWEIIPVWGVSLWINWSE